MTTKPHLSRNYDQTLWRWVWCLWLSREDHRSGKAPYRCAYNIQDLSKYEHQRPRR